MEGRAMTEVVNHCPLTSETWARSRACLRKIGRGTGFCLGTCRRSLSFHQCSVLIYMLLLLE
jgi:hypothetical protein